MEKPPLRYQHLTVLELEANLQSIEQQRWDTMDLLHALEVGRTAVILALREVRRGAQE